MHIKGAEGKRISKGPKRRGKNKIIIEEHEEQNSQESKRNGQEGEGAS